MELWGRLARLPDIRRVGSLATVSLIRPDAEGGVRLDATLAAGAPEESSSLCLLADLTVLPPVLLEGSDRNPG